MCVEGFGDPWPIYHNCSRGPTVASLFTRACDLLQLKDPKNKMVMADGKLIDLKTEMWSSRDTKVFTLSADWFIELNFVFPSHDDREETQAKVPVDRTLCDFAIGLLGYPKGRVKSLLLIRASGGPRMLISNIKEVRVLLQEKKIKTGDSVEVRFELQREPVRGHEVPVTISLKGQPTKVKLMLQPGEVILKEELLQRMTAKNVITWGYVHTLSKSVKGKLQVTNKIDGSYLEYVLSENVSKIQMDVLFGSPTATETRLTGQIMDSEVTFKDIVQNHPDVDRACKEYCVQAVRRDGTPWPEYITDLNRKPVEYFSTEGEKNVKAFVIMPRSEVTDLRDRKAVRCKITVVRDSGQEMMFETFDDGRKLTDIADFLCAADKGSRRVYFMVRGREVSADEISHLSLYDIAEDDKVVEITVRPKATVSDLGAMAVNLKEYKPFKVPTADTQNVLAYEKIDHPDNCILVKLVNPDEQSGKRNIEGLKEFSHPCILKFLGLVDMSSRLGVVCEYRKGFISLDQLLFKPREYGVMSATDKAKVITGIAMAMSYLHGKKVVHRNLCPACIMVDETRHPFITDFAVARVIDAPGMALTLNVGSPGYSAPETMLSAGTYTDKVDVWSFGVLVYEILAGKRAFGGFGRLFDIMNKVVSGSMPQFPRDLQDTMIEGIVHACWDLTASHRPSFEKLIEEFRAAKYQFIPGVDSEVVANFVERVKMS